MSIILQDQDGMKAQAEVLGAGELYPLLACMLTRKSWDKIMPNATADDPHSVTTTSGGDGVGAAAAGAAGAAGSGSGDNNEHITIAAAAAAAAAETEGAHATQQHPGSSVHVDGGVDAVVLFNPDSSDEAKAELQGNVTEYAKEIVTVLSTVNRYSAE